MKARRKDSRWGWLLLSFIVTTSSLSLTACRSPREGTSKTDVSKEDVKRETQEALRTTQAYLLQQKRAYQEKVEAELNRLDNRIAELKRKAEKAGTETQAKLGATMKELQRKKDVARRKLEELKSSSAQAWEDLKAGVDAAVDDLHKSYERARSQYKAS